MLSFTFLTISMLLLFTPSPQPAVSSRHNNFTDLSALLAFKAHVRDPSGILARNWTSSTSFCTWTGVSCSHRRQRVTALKLSGFSLQGSIAPHLGNLSFLSILRLRNNALVGHIPQALGHLPRLKTLVLERNRLSGSIPHAVFNMTSLVTLRLASNNLTGSLPAVSNRSLALPRLQDISTSENRLMGEIPSGFLHCHGLRVLSLSVNRFTGFIPMEVGTLSELRLLYLGSNELTGMIPPSVGNLTKLIEIDLRQNHLSGGIPSELGGLPNVQWLNLGTNFLTGAIPTSLSNFSQLSDFDLSENNLTGPVPVALGKNVPLLTWLDLGNNRLTGGLDFIESLSNCRALDHLLLPSNELDGALPESVGNLSMQLAYIDASENHIKGGIPAALGNLSSLIFLDLSGNDLTGRIPSPLTGLENLQSLYLYQNRLDGPIPDAIGRLRSLFQLILYDNALSGSIPPSTGNITALQDLWLAYNRLSSSIPPSIWRLRNLIELQLSRNALDGVLPPDVGNLENIGTLDLSANQLGGIIPITFGDLQMLTYLDLSHNSFHGIIPQSLGRLIIIEYLDLSSNSLSATIPKSLASLPHNASLNLSFNRLRGEIPMGGLFSSDILTIQSLMGNAALCGGAPRLGFPPCHANPVAVPRSRKIKVLRLLKYILPTIACTVALLALISYIRLVIRQRRRTQALAHTSTPQIQERRSISYHELVRATDNFSEANLLGRGGFGSVFKGCLADGTIAAIKVLNLEMEGASRSFEAECHALRMVRHRNLVKIISTCSSLNFKVLVLQFMPNGSLERWLYSHNYCLTLLQRINIMLDVASALEYLHHHHFEVIVHCDLKPSNVLLDEDMTAHVGDFGIAKLLLGDSRSRATSSTHGTIGYMAPEYGSTGRVSRKVDVYSYGIMLLETFTRKKPTDAMFTGERSLREMVTNAYPAAVSEIVDSNLLKDVAITGSRCEAGNGTRNEDLSSIILLGLLCSQDSPKERISMIDVVPRLEKIRVDCMSHLSNS